MHVVIVFLGQSITNKLVIGGALGIGHGLHQLGAKTPLEALYLSSPWYQQNLEHT